MRNSIARGLPLSILVVLILSFAACAAVPHIGEEEMGFGKDAAKEVESEHKILNDEALLARVQAIGTPIAVEANNIEVEACYGSSDIVTFPYTFKIIDDDDVNAFSVPGGHIYVFKGLIENCQSDHELAGVIAHEIVHAAHHHTIHLMREQSKMEGKMAILLVAGLVSNVNPRDMSNVIAGAQFYKTARINGYGQRAEEDADLVALTYMKRAGYNPVGTLTFLERLAERPEVIDWGILQTHPRPGDRVRIVHECLESEGVEINRRAVTTWSTARVKQVADLVTHGTKPQNYGRVHPRNGPPVSLVPNNEC